MVPVSWELTVHFTLLAVGQRDIMDKGRGVRATKGMAQRQRKKIIAGDGSLLRTDCAFNVGDEREKRKVESWHWRCAA